jgi:hypothetical protein
MELRREALQEHRDHHISVECWWDTEETVAEALSLLNPGMSFTALGFTLCAAAEMIKKQPPLGQQSVDLAYVIQPGSLMVHRSANSNLDLAHCP